MGSTRKSVAYSTLANFGSQALTLVLLIFSARWLHPAEIGAFAVAFSVILLLEPLREFQLVAYVIQSPAVDRMQMRRVQFVGMVVSLVGLLVCAVAVVAMRAGFDKAEVGNLLLIMSATFLIKPIAQPATAVLSREMRFGAIAAIKIVGVLLKVGLTIGLFLAGLRAEALAIGYIAEIACELAAVALVPGEYRLPLPMVSGSRAIWSFCSRASGAQLMNRLSTSAVDLLVGSYLGLIAAGFFNRANSLVRAFRSGLESAIFPIAISVFARANRADKSETRLAYLGAITLLTGISWSALGLFVVLANPLVHAAYGSRWEAIIPVSQVLALSGMVYAATALSQTLLASVGAVDALLKRETFIQIPRLAILFVTTQFDIMTVAWGTVASMVVALVVNQGLIGALTGMSYRNLGAALYKSAALAILTCTAAGLSLLALEQVTASPILLLAGSVPVAGIAWLVGIFALQHPLRDELRKIAGRVNVAPQRKTPGAD